MENTFGEADRQLRGLEAGLVRAASPPLADIVEQTIDLVRRLIIAYLGDEGKKQPPAPQADLLEALKVLMKGEPSWNAIRDNCRELVYYRNCLAMDRANALPAAPEKMAVRTARHIYLYLMTRCIREGSLEERHES